MAQTKTLVRQTDRIRVYEIREDDGTLACLSEEPIPTAEDTNAATLRDRAQQALAANATFLANASPTNAQVLAQTRLLTRQTSVLIRLVLNLLDSTDGT